MQIAAGFHPDYLLADADAFHERRRSRDRDPKNEARHQVLLFSGHANSSELRDEARLKGHNFDVVAKPIHPEKLVKLLEKDR